MNLDTGTWSILWIISWNTVHRLWVLISSLHEDHYLWRTPFVPVYPVSFSLVIFLQFRKTDVSITPKPLFFLPETDTERPREIYCWFFME